MNKDIIYIDVDDDITAIIGKVKSANQKIVALVPPKRIGVLQSAVNLRLLARAATQSDKRLVLITNNAALTALAAAAQLPIAKNLQSKPELAQIPALDIDDGEDVIDGSQLPIGELARTADTAPLGAAALADPAVDEVIKANTSRAQPPLAGAAPVRPKVKSGTKVPNFNKFRKKLLIIIAAAILLIGFLVWALVYAPRATVLITARTNDSSANIRVALSETAATDATAATLRSTSQQLKKDVSIDFTATGTKDAGTKASGKMTVTRTSVSNSELPVPAGTSFTAGGRTFLSTEGTTLGPTTVGASGIVQDSATVGVQAQEIGDESNLSARSYQSSVSGISASGSEMSGGTHRMIKIVTAEDVQKATDTLAQQGTEEIKTELVAQFDSNAKVIDASFTSDAAAVKPAPAIDQEAPDGKAKLAGQITYTMSGVDASEMSKYLEAYFNEEIKDLENQRIYDNGADQVTFTNVTAVDSGYAANLSATAKTGPKIDDEEVKTIAKGKRYGEIQSSIVAIQGIDNVDVKFWPFWVSTAPNDASKITVEFELDE